MSAELLDAECEVLAQALRAPGFPKALRADARRLLQQAFRDRSDDDAPAALLATRADEVEALLRTANAHRPRRLRHLERRMDPVKLRAARGVSPFALRADRFLAVGQSFEKRVDWMWERCKRSAEPLRKEPSVQERAAQEFGVDDLEFVWGRKRQT